MNRCPICFERHHFKTIEFQTFARMDGMEIPYIGITYECDRCSVISSDAIEQINKENERRIAEVRRSNAGYYTAIQIKEIREKYQMTAKEFAVILGTGVASLKRYEAKGGQWQSRSTENLLRLVDWNAECMLRCLECWANEIPEDRYCELREHITKMIECA